MTVSVLGRGGEVTYFYIEAGVNFTEKITTDLFTTKFDIGFVSLNDLKSQISCNKWT